MTSVMYRSRAFDAPVLADGEDPTLVRMIASSNAPVRTRISVDGEEQTWDEILEHVDGNIDVSAARSVLLNHRPDAVVGSIKSIRFDGTTSIMETNIMPSARMETGVSVLDAVRCRALSGVSIGYAYRTDNDDTELDFENRTIRVRKWRLLEATLTPIPADPIAGVRSITRSHKGPQMSDPASPVVAAASAAVAAPTPTVDVSGVRAEAGKIAAMADSLKLRSADFVSLSLADAQAKMLDAVAARDAAAGAKVTENVRSVVEVREDASDKIAKRAVGALLWSAGFQYTNERAANIEFEDGTKLRDYQAQNTIRGRTMTDIIRSTVEAHGGRAGELDRHAIAAVALGKRDAANVQTGFFTNFVFANLLKKAVSVGYQMGGKSIKYEKLVSRNYVPDYKLFAIGNLGTGNLQNVVENQAFPELDKSEGSYQDRVQMWGGTISLSEQAIVSDDTGRFMDNLRMAGAIAKKTIDKRVFQKLLLGPNGAWTSNTTASAGIGYTTADGIHAARTNLAKTVAGLMNKLGQDGNPLGTIASYLVVPPTLSYQAAGILGLAPGQQNTTNMQFEVVSTPWLEFSGLTGYSTTSYYLVADPSEATGLVLSTINGIDEPRVEQYDPGAVAAYKWKIYMPFEAGVGSHSISTSGSALNIVAGMQQGTA